MRKTNEGQVGAAQVWCISTDLLTSTVMGWPGLRLGRLSQNSNKPQYFGLQLQGNQYSILIVTLNLKGMSLLQLLSVTTAVVVFTM